MAKILNEGSQKPISKFARHLIGNGQFKFSLEEIHEILDGQHDCGECGCKFKLKPKDLKRVKRKHTRNFFELLFPCPNPRCNDCVCIFCFDKYEFYPSAGSAFSLDSTSSIGW